MSALSDSPVYTWHLALCAASDSQQMASTSQQDATGLPRFTIPRPVKRLG